MRSGLSSFRGRLAASVTAILGLSAVSGCSPRGVSDADRMQQPVATPQQTINQQPQEVYGTTQALGEEEASYPVPVDQSVTTFAIGEEDGSAPYNPPQTYQPVPSDQMATTLAIGEEDGSGPFPVEPNGGIGDGAGPIPQVEGDFERIYIPPAPG